MKILLSAIFVLLVVSTVHGDETETIKPAEETEVLDPVLPSSLSPRKTAKRGAYGYGYGYGFAPYGYGNYYSFGYPYRSYLYSPYSFGYPYGGYGGYGGYHGYTGYGGFGYYGW